MFSKLPRGFNQGHATSSSPRRLVCLGGSFRLLLLVLVSGCSGGVETDGVASGSDSEATEDEANASMTAHSAVDMPSDAVAPDTSGQNTSTGVNTGSSAPDPRPAPVDENPAIAPTSFECTQEPNGISIPLRRLSKQQYQNSVVDIVSRLLGDGVDADTARGLLASVPDDERLKLPQELHGTYRRLDQRVQQPHVDAWYAAGISVGQWLAAPERLTALLGPCAETEAEDDADVCIDAFIRRFGRLAFRRPMSDEEVTFYRGFYAPSTGIDPAGVADVVGGMLNAPDFLYLVEGRAELPSNGVDSGALTAHELAARLSYHFWNAPPDPQLEELADSGELLEADVYETQVQRLFEDERTAATVADFYREWLRLEDLEPLDRNNGSPLFQAFAGDNLPTNSLHASAREEALALLHHFTFESPGGITDLLSTRYSFARSNELASLYGVEAWSGAGEPPLLGTTRPGLLTRGAFLMTGTANTRPIMRGLFIRTALLCDSIDPPPAAAGATPPEVSPDWTTREVVEQLTAPAACYGCHNLFINPLGFALEAFDSLGRERNVERLFDSDGSEMGTKSIDTHTVPQVILGDMTPSSGAADLMAQMVTSGKVEACMARQYFRFTFGRWEKIGSDGCVLESMRETLADDGDLAALLRRVASEPSFQRRATDEAPATETL